MSKSTHSEAYNHFRKLLIKARTSAGLKQIDVARQLGKPQSYVSKYETGERRVDIIEFLEIAAVLHLNVAEFIEEVISIAEGRDNGSSIQGL